MTLVEIKQKMLDYLDGIGCDDDGYYDGYAGQELFDQIVDFWHKFNKESDLLYVSSGEFMDDVDLDGGRMYLLSLSGVIPMIFDYLYNNMGYTKEGYSNIIYNSLSITDEIEDMFDQIHVIRDTKIDTIVKEIPETKVEDDFDYIVLKYPSEIKEQLDKMSGLEYVGDSRIDKDPVYKVKVPKGYQIIQKLEVFL